MARYDKDEIKSKLTLEQIFEIVEEFGGEPRYTDFGFISSTICHNVPGEGSHKLYYYENTNLFRCYTECDSCFDIFELIEKIQTSRSEGSDWNLYDSICWVASRYGWGPTIEDTPTSGIPDWSILEQYKKIHLSSEQTSRDLQLPAFDTKILDYLNYPIISDWIEEGMTEEVLSKNLIGYYPVDEQITIPHFDINNRFIGLRGRALGREEAELYGKYRPIVANHQMYNHPLGLNLYNINNSAKNIQKAKIAIVFEGEKSSLLYQSYFGIENDISVACCGFAIKPYQMQLLIDLGVREIVIAFDRQFRERNDEEFKHLVKNFQNIHRKYGQYIITSFILDKENILPYKASPIDCGAENFLNLFKKRIIL